MIDDSKPNVFVACDHCGKRTRVNYSHCLRRGWPRCCSRTMVLASKTSRTMIREAVRDAMSGVEPTLRLVALVDKP